MVPCLKIFFAALRTLPKHGREIMWEAGIAALLGSATAFEFRERGVETALINHRLLEATQQGSEFAVVSTMPPAVRSGTWSAAAFA